MLQAVRSATNQRRQDGGLGRRTSIEMSGSREDTSVHHPPELGHKLGRQPSRFREAIMQAEEASVRRLRATEVAKGGLWLRIFGIGKTFGGLPGSRLIHPHSPFSMGLLCCSALLLLYSALASAFLVGFLWLVEACDAPAPTLYFDVVVDVFFLLEIAAQFGTGAYIGGEYTDDIRKVAMRYLGGGFIFDVATSIPVSFVELAIARQCSDMAMSGERLDAMSADSNILRIIRTSKALRVARLLRAFKIVARLKSIIGFMSLIGDYLRIPPYVLRITKIGMLITMLVHVCTCAFYLIRSTSNDEAVFHDFLDVEMLSHNPREDLSSKYVLSFYFVNTVFCTIGFGDIAGTNNVERLFCVVLFYLGVFVFGSLLVEVQDAIQKAGLDRRDREQELNSMISFLRAEDVPRVLERYMVKWADFGMREQQRYENRVKVLAMVPTQIHRQIMHALHQGLLSSVPLFTRMDNKYREDLLLDLWETMKPRVYSAFVPITAAGSFPAELYVVSAGTVILQKGNDIVSTLKKGDSFGERYLLLGEKVDGDEDLVDNRYVAVTDVSCMLLRKESFDRVVASYNDKSMAEYFDSCRARLREENAQSVIDMDESEEDFEHRKNGQDQHLHAAEACRSPERSRILLRSPSLVSQVSRARWINLVKKAYNKKIANDSLWYRVGERAHALAQVPLRTRSTESSPRGQPDPQVERAARDDSIRAGPRMGPQMDRVAPPDCFSGSQATIDAGLAADLKAEMERLVDLMATMCKRMQNLEAQHVHLHRSLLPASTFVNGVAAAGQVSEGRAQWPEETSLTAAFSSSQGNDGLSKADDVAHLEDVEGTVTESAQA